MGLNKEATIALYQSINDGNEDRVFELWHASSIGMCPKAHYLKRLGVAETCEPASGAKVIRWQAGHAIEGFIRAHIKNVYGETWSNFRHSSEALQLTGEFDNYVPAERRLVEVKSVHDFAFVEHDGQVSLKEATGERNKWGKPVYKPKDTPYLHHELQNHAYVLLLGELGLQVAGIDYIYISLSGRMAVYSTEVQPRLLDNVTARLNALNEAWAAQQPPVCICRPDHPLYDGVMQFCNYKRTPYGTPDEHCCEVEISKETE